MSVLVLPSIDFLTIVINVVLQNITPLERECLDQLQEYVRKLGGDLGGEWKCRAQIRDIGSRAGSIDTWFTSPQGDVYRSKVAVARGLGLETSSGPSKPRAPRDPNKPPRAPREKKPKAEKQEDGGDGDGNGSGGAGGSTKPKKEGKGKGKGKGKSKDKDSSKPAVGADGKPVKPKFIVSLEPNDVADLLMSMPTAIDTDEVYEGPMFYREIEMKRDYYQEKLDSKYKRAMQRQQAEEAANEAAKAARAAGKNKVVEEEDDDEDDEDEEEDEDVDVMNEDEQVKGEAAVDAKEEEKEEAANGVDNKSDEGTANGAADTTAKEDADDDPMDTDAPDAAKTADEDEEGDDEQEGKDDESFELAPYSRRHAAAAARMKTAALVESSFESDHDQSDAEWELASLPRIGPDPALEPVRLELELIRKCFVKVPPRLGRPMSCEPPVAMSPVGVKPHTDTTEVLLELGEVRIFDRPVVAPQPPPAPSVQEEDPEEPSTLEDAVEEDPDFEERPSKRGRRAAAPKSFVALAAGTDITEAIAEQKGKGRGKKGKAAAAAAAAEVPKPQPQVIVPVEVDENDPLVKVNFIEICFIYLDLKEC